MNAFCDSAAIVALTTSDRRVQKGVNARRERRPRLFSKFLITAAAPHKARSASSRPRLFRPADRRACQCGGWSPRAPSFLRRSDSCRKCGKNLEKIIVSFRDMPHRMILAVVWPIGL